MEVFSQANVISNMVFDLKSACVSMNLRFRKIQFANLWRIFFGFTNPHSSSQSRKVWWRIMWPRPQKVWSIGWVVFELDPSPDLKESGPSISHPISTLKSFETVLSGFGRIKYRIQIWKLGFKNLTYQLWELNLWVRWVSSKTNPKI